VTSWPSILLAVGFLSPFAVLSPGAVQYPTSPSFIECGGGVAGSPGVVVVHLLDGTRARSWSLTLEAGILGPRGVEWAATGAIRIELNASGGPWACQATPPSSFHVRSTARFLAGSTLRVLARAPVRVEIQDAEGRVLASRNVDPAAGQTTTIGW
jgi:hypothetical protein